MCMIDGADGDYSEFHSTNTHRANKEHFCDECRRTIFAGETYERTHQKWDGQFFTYKTCEHCVAARSWLSVTCGGWMYYGVLEDLKTHFTEESHLFGNMRLGRLVQGMRRGWRSPISGELMKVPRPFTAMELPYKMRQPYDKRTTRDAGQLTLNGETLFTEHGYIYE